MFIFKRSHFFYSFFFSFIHSLFVCLMIWKFECVRYLANKLLSSFSCWMVLVIWLVYVFILFLLLLLILVIWNSNYKHITKHQTHIVVRVHKTTTYDHFDFDVRSSFCFNSEHFFSLLFSSFFLTKHSCVLQPLFELQYAVFFSFIVFHVCWFIGKFWQTTDLGVVQLKVMWR